MIFTFILVYRNNTNRINSEVQGWTVSVPESTLTNEEIFVVSKGLSSLYDLFFNFIAHSMMLMIVRWLVVGI